MLLGGPERDLLDVVKQLKNFRVRALEFLVLEKTQRAEKCGDQKFAAPLLAIQINIQQITGIILRLKPRTAIGDNAKRMQHLAIGMLRGLEGQTGRTVQLADHHALGAIDHKTAGGRHQGHLAHKHFFLLHPLAFLELEGHVKCRAVGAAILERLKPALLGRVDLVTMEIEHDISIVAFDGKHLLEHSLKAFVLALIGRGVDLQKIDVRVALDFNEVGRFNDLFNFAVVDPLVFVRCHIAICPCRPLAGGVAPKLLSRFIPSKSGSADPPVCAPSNRLRNCRGGRRGLRPPPVPGKKPDYLSSTFAPASSSTF